MNTEPWPQSRKAATFVGGVAMPGQASTTPDSEIQAIANMMDKMDRGISAPQGPSIQSNIGMNMPMGIRPGQIINPTPEAVSDMMIQSYIKRNGSVILD